MSSFSSVDREEQWQADPVGQTTFASKGERTSCAHLLADGALARHIGRVSEAATICLSGMAYSRGWHFIMTL